MCRHSWGNLHGVKYDPGPTIRDCEEIIAEFNMWDKTTQAQLALQDHMLYRQYRNAKETLAYYKNNKDINEKPHT